MVAQERLDLSKLSSGSCCGRATTHVFYRRNRLGNFGWAEHGDRAGNSRAIGASAFCGRRSTWLEYNNDSGGWLHSFAWPIQVGTDLFNSIRCGFLPWITSCLLAPDATLRVGRLHELEILNRSIPGMCRLPFGTSPYLPIQSSLRSLRFL